MAFGGSHSRGTKTRRLPQRERRRLAVFLAVLAALSVAAAVAVAVAVAVRVSRIDLVPIVRRVEVVDGNIEIPLRTLPTPSAGFFEYDAAGGQSRRFIVARSRGGSIVAVIDACTPCGSAGHRVRSDQLFCSRCGAGFPLEFLGGGHDECEPRGLPTRIVGAELRLSVRDLELNR